MPQDRQSRFQSAITFLNDASAELRGVTLTPAQLIELEAAAHGLINLAKSRATR